MFIYNFLLIFLFSFMRGAQEELDKAQLQRKFLSDPF